MIYYYQDEGRKTQEKSQEKKIKKLLTKIIKYDIMITVRKGKRLKIMKKSNLYVQGYLIPTDRANKYMAEHPRYYELMILDSGSPRFKIFGSIRTEYTHVPNLDLAVLFQHHFPDLCLHIQQGIYTAHI